ncbi:MAG: chemotaxis protein CheW [Lachnospiraceae bacterium]|nr:chemotaxis protein CheW [Lachnospiraceae bacterium]
MEELAITTEVTQYIKIRIQDEYFGIDIKYVDNIVRMQHITRVPMAPSYIKGVINLRGEVIPVFSLRLKMGLEEIEENKSFRIIILKYEGESVGIIVDEVREVANVASNDVEKVYHNNTDSIQNFLSGVGKTENGLISLLDIVEVLNDKAI